MSRQIINVTDITEYLFCPRKVYLKLVKKVRFPPNKQMINGMLRHKVFDLLNKNEAALVSSIKENLQESEIKEMYETLLNKIINEILFMQENLVKTFEIDRKEFAENMNKEMKKEIQLRVEAIKHTIDSGFLGKELWRNLSPKYLTEFSLESLALGLRGRIDRVKFSQEITPFEIKTRKGKGIFESDKIQLAAYSLLLEEEFGRKIEKGIVEMLDKTEEVQIDEELKKRVQEIAEEIRNMEEGKFPSNFNKCKECRIKKECLEY